MDKLFEAICAGLMYEVKTSMYRQGAIQKRARLAGREAIFMARTKDQADYKKYQFYRQQLLLAKKRMNQKLGNRAKLQARKVLR